MDHAADVGVFSLRFGQENSTEISEENQVNADFHFIGEKLYFL